MYKSIINQKLLWRFLSALAFIFVVQASNSCNTDYTTNQEIVTCTNLTFDNKSIIVLNNDLNRDYTRILIVNKSDITKLPLDSTLEPLINFTIAFFSNAHINEIEEFAFSIMPNLAKLDLSNNNIGMITPRIFDYLENLNILDLSNNSITTITVHLFSTSNIGTLNLSSNHVSTWDSISSMSKIEVLDFSKNSFSSFSLEQMPSTLKVLNLEQNKIGKFETTENKSYVSKLMYLDLSENMISDLEPLPLKNLKNLERLYLQKNNISTFPKGCFSDLHHLRYLDASDNNLKVIQSGLFDTLSLLETLILSDNHLTALGYEHFRFLYKLSQLYIDNNEMSTLNLTVMIEPPTHLKNVSLDGNTFSCDYLSGLIQAMVDAGIDVADGVHSKSSNINGNTCYKQHSGGNDNFFKSNRLSIILSILAGVIVALSIPWCVIYYKKSKSRRGLLENMEMTTYNT